ncbi:hypothetical protein DL93DRAFT_1325060 [Clavulina sp. PMI_390]|nr:hypothetical protein DL93DRAFT_1325060 [Clavulina sp. PMI_390]
MSTNMSLPPSFRSLYRITLRALSASVAHHRAAARNMRRLYRPTFDQAAAVHMSPASMERASWLAEFDKRMDNTIAFLIVSATVNSTAHKVTQSSALQLHAQLASSHSSSSSSSSSLPSPSSSPLLNEGPVIKWDPLNPSHAADLAAKRAARRAKTSERKKRIADAAVRNEWAVREVRSMAEGMGGIVLGRKELVRVPIKGSWRFNQQKDTDTGGN